MDAEEMMHDGTGASLSTNATAFCIASLIGAGDREDGDEGPLTTEQNAGVSDRGADSDDDGNESNITSKVSYKVIMTVINEVFIVLKRLRVRQFTMFS